MTMTTSPASSSPTIEDMASGGIDALFDALDTTNPGHPLPDEDEDDRPEPTNEDEDPEGDEPEDEEQDSDEEDDSESDKDSDETPEKGADELELETTQVAQLFGLEEDAVDVDEEGGIVFKTKIDGEAGTVHLNDLVQSYQIQGHLTKQSQKFAEEKNDAQSFLQEQAQVLTQQLESAEALTEAARDKLLAQNSSIDWDKLRVTDPAEFAAKRQEMGEQYRQVDLFLQQIQAQKNQQSEELQKQEQERFSQYVQDQGRQLVEKFPEWQDPKVRVAEQKDIKMYLASKGFTPEEMSNIVDARHIEVLKDALQAKKTTGKVNVAKKKVAKVPKVVKPGARAPKSQELRGKRKSALKKQRQKSTRDTDAAAFYELIGDDF